MIILSAILKSTNPQDKMVMQLKRIFSAALIVIILALLFGSLGSANVIVVNSEKSLNVNVLMDNGSPVVSRVGIGGFTVFKLAKNGTVEWSITGGDFIPVNADLLRAPFYSPSGISTTASKARDGGILIGFVMVGKNGPFSPAMMKIASNGSFEWAYVYKLGQNISPYINSIYAGKDGILMSGYIGNNTPSGTKFLPFLLLLRPNGTVAWARIYHPPLLRGINSGEALEVNGSYVYILQDDRNAILLRLDRNGNVTGVNSVSGMKTVNSAASDGKYLYLLGTDENGTVLAKFDLTRDDLIWAKEYSIEFNYTRASCSPNETNMTMVASKAVSNGFKQLLHVGDGLEVFPMPFELRLPLEGVPCNESIFKQEAALKPVTAVFKVDDGGNLLYRKIIVLNSTYSPESFDYSNETFVLGMMKSIELLSTTAELKPLILVGHFSDLLNLSLAKDTDLNVTVRNVSVHLGDVHLWAVYPLSKALNISAMGVEPVNIVKKVPEDVEIRVYRTKTMNTEKSTTTGKSTKDVCGPAFLVALAILPALLFFRRK